MLRGSAGLKRIEVNSVGRVMRELSREPGQPGANIQLTIDARLQNFALARLQDRSAAAVVIDVKTGDILACVSAPSFDPNLFVRGISSKDYRTLMDNDHRPLSNKAVSGHLSAGLHLQDQHRARSAEIRRSEGDRQDLLPRLYRRWRTPLPLLETFRPWLAGI